MGVARDGDIEGTSHRTNKPPMHASALESRWGLCTCRLVVAFNTTQRSKCWLYASDDSDVKK